MFGEPIQKQAAADSDLFLFAFYLKNLKILSGRETGFCDRYGIIEMDTSEQTLHLPSQPECGRVVFRGGRSGFIGFIGVYGLLPQ